jgi:NADH-quinone oxidoreductase subunit L
MHHAYHATHSHEDAQDMRNMGGLARYLPWTCTLMWIATLAISGIPPFSGFFSKDEILGAAFARGTVQPVWYIFWGLGLGAALLTAFYMTRMMLYTFHGPNRTGTQEETQLHEAPAVMTGPLVVLGILSLAGGALNLPSLVGGTAWLEHWLEPITAAGAALVHLPEVASSTEWTLIGIAVAIAIVGIVAALRVLDRTALVPAKSAPAETGLGSILNKKWYVDELYDAVVVRPIMWFSRAVLWRVVDVGIIDGVGVNGAAATSRILGWLTSRLQTGELGFYAVMFVIGVVVVLARALR